MVEGGYKPTKRDVLAQNHGDTFQKSEEGVWREVLSLNSGAELGIPKPYDYLQEPDFRRFSELGLKIISLPHISPGLPSPAGKTAFFDYHPGFRNGAFPQEYEEDFWQSVVKGHGSRIVATQDQVGVGSDDHDWKDMFKQLGIEHLSGVLTIREPDMVEAALLSLRGLSNDGFVMDLPEPMLSYGNPGKIGSLVYNPILIQGRPPLEYAMFIADGYPSQVRYQASVQGRAIVEHIKKPVSLTNSVCRIGALPISRVENDGSVSDLSAFDIHINPITHIAEVIPVFTNVKDVYSPEMMAEMSKRRDEVELDSFGNPVPQSWW